MKSKKIGIFEKYLTIWVALCMGLGIVLGNFIPRFGEFLSKLQVANINIPIAVLIWLMVFPMVLKIDFLSIKGVFKKPRGLVLTWIINWLVKPFTMYGISALFFYVFYKGIIPPDRAENYLIGTVLLGAAPCTAMVFVWSSLTNGNSSYTLMQVATNDLIILVAFIPIVGLLLGGSIGFDSIPWLTLSLSIVFYVVIPLLMAMAVRRFVIYKRDLDYLNNKVIKKMNPVTIIGLLFTLVIIFSMNAKDVVNYPLDIFLIAVPLIIQTVLIFAISYFTAKLIKLPHDIAAPAGMIGASNFFELSVAVAVTTFAGSPGVVLATTVGVLVEVPVMLSLVWFANRTKHWFVLEGNVPPKLEVR